LAGVKGLVLELGSVLGLDLSRAAEVAEISDEEIRRLIERREKARSTRDFKAADDIRRSLSDRGVILEDTKDGTQWRKRI
jgi:cysteinyl-tRNA synthetase